MRRPRGPEDGWVAATAGVCVLMQVPDGAQKMHRMQLGPLCKDPLMLVQAVRHAYLVLVVMIRYA
jgi:hypothetical protein